MKNAKKSLAMLLAAMVAMGSLAGCGSDKPVTDNSSKAETDSSTASKTEETPVKADDVQEFSFKTGDEPNGLNPILNNTEPDYSVCNIFYETLIRYGANEDNVATVKPGMAEKWEISEDGKTYTFHLRDAKWSDGVAVKADDFVYTYRTMADPAVASTCAFLLSGLVVNFQEALLDEEGKKPADIGVSAPDDKTVVIQLTKSTPYFLSLLSKIKPIRQDKYEEFGAAYGSDVSKIVTNGMFNLQSWDPNVQMTFVKNPEYWNAENVKLEKINRKIIKELATGAQAYLAGDIDTFGTSDPDWKKAIEDDGNYTVISQVQTNPEYVIMNCSNKYLKNAKIRLALSLAYDREGLVESIADGLGEPLYSMMPSPIGLGDKLYTDVVGGANQKILKDLVAKYPDPKALLIEGLKEEGLDPDPAKMELSYLSRGTGEWSKKEAEWLLQMWREKLGIEIKIDLVEWNIMWGRIDSGDYDIATGGWTPDYNDPDALLSIFDPEIGYFDAKKTGWTDDSSKKFHELIVKEQNETDPAERAKLLLEAETLLVSEAVVIPTYTGISNTYVRNYVKGYHTSPSCYMDYSNLYIEGK
ncbi:MAG: peptide ABC transporter substrate-binding protein [Oscillospiraceae bacterium]